MMRILMIAPQPFFQPRGTPISVFQRLEGASALGHQVDLLTYHVGQNVEMAGITIHRTIAIPFIKQVRIGPSPVKLLLDLLVFIKAFYLLMTKRYDIIHSHEEGSFMALLLGLVSNVPHLYDMHSRLSSQIEHSKWGRFRFLVTLFEWLERKVVERADAVITIGYDLADYVLTTNPTVPHCKIENMAVQPAKPKTIAAIAAELAQQFGEGKRYLVYTGTFESYQGLDLLLDASHEIITACPNARIVLVGGRPDQVSLLQSEINRRALQEYFYLPGVVPLATAMAYLANATLLLSPRTEGLSVPLKIYSYLFAAKPIVATRLVAHTQVLTDEIAYLIEPSSQALADSIQTLLSDEALCQKLGQNARIFAEATYTTVAYLDNLRNIYQQTIGEPAGAKSAKLSQL